MTPLFLTEYLRADTERRSRALSIMNPTKCWAMAALLAVHLGRTDDKIIVFSDSVYALRKYAEAFGCVSARPRCVAFQLTDESQQATSHLRRNGGSRPRGHPRSVPHRSSHARSVPLQSRRYCTRCSRRQCHHPGALDEPVARGSRRLTNPLALQISSHFGSRMQEAQRMGRILRKKKQAKATSRA